MVPASCACFAAENIRPATPALTPVAPEEQDVEGALATRRGPWFVQLL
jgi:hypothetical protein